MKKILIYGVIFTFATFIIPTKYVSASDSNGNLPHVDGNSQFPPTKWQSVRHTLQIHVPKNSKAISQLRIEVPDTIRWSKDKDDVKVMKGDNDKINTNISVNGANILLTFPELIAPNTQFEIDINKIRQPRLGNGSTYRIYAQFAGSDKETLVDTAFFRLYL